ncbi:MAG TPA: hypothetical protein VFX97_14015 [Pyrinomonadaceae bacterium]|nr:hypothetical protein [Pyrinomonadaceae bacterium]
MAKVADTLWQFNEPQARRLFAGAFNAIDSIKLDSGKDQRVRIAAATGGHGPLAGVRAEVLQAIAAHDFKLADDLRESLKEPKIDSNTGKSAAELAEKEELAWDIAAASAKQQPQRTAQFVRSQLRKGITEELGWALVNIRRNNQPLAEQLFSESVAVARQNLNASENLEILSVYVLPSEAEAFYGQPPDPSRDDAVRPFLAYAADRLLWQSATGHANPPRGAEAQQEHRVLESLLPLFERLTPQKVALLRERMGVLLGNMTTRQADAALSKPEDIAELVRQAESIVGSEKRDRRLIQVSQIAARQGEIDLALSIAEKISDLAERSIQVSLISYQASLKLLKNGELEEAYRYARRIEFLPQRIAAFNVLAKKLRASKDDDRARLILEEISEWIDKADNTPQKARALLTLVLEMSRYDAERSFQLLASAIKTINTVDFSSPKSTASSRELQVTLDMLDLETVFHRLTDVNRDRALQAAQSLTHKEASLLSQAIVCAEILATNPELHAESPAPNQPY